MFSINVVLLYGSISFFRSLKSSKLSSHTVEEVKKNKKNEINDFNDGYRYSKIMKNFSYIIFKFI